MGCSAEKRIVGEYVSKDSSPLSSEKVLISEEGSFKVSSWSDVAGEFTSTGTWRLNSDTLLLKRSKSERSDKNYHYTYDPTTKGTRIEVRWKNDSTGNPFSKVFLNEHKMPLDSIKKGIFYSEAETIQSVRIFNLGDYVDAPKPKSNANILVYYWELSGESSVDIGLKWKFKSGKLYPLEPGHSILVKKK